MLTQHDIQALIELLQRTPMTKPEQLFASGLIDKLTKMLDVPDTPDGNEADDATGHNP